MLDDRKQKIFFSIVENYIALGEPVGSKSLLSIFSDSISSATIRNEMARLTELGLIDQPHTSAGRIPTERGIRYYIDNLMEKEELSRSDKTKIDSIFSKPDSDPNRFLLKASDTFSDMLGCAVIGKTAKEREAVKSIELLIPSRGMFVVVLLTSGNEVKSKICVPTYEISAEEISYFCENINRFFSSVPLSSVTTSFIQSVAASMGLYGLALSPLLSAVADLCKSVEDDRFFLEGESNLLLSGAADRYSLKEIKRLVESGEIQRVLPERTDKTEIILGSELPFRAFSPFCMITTPYKIGNETGTIGIISPIRTSFSKIVPCLEYFAESFSKHYNGGSK